MIADVKPYPAMKDSRVPWLVEGSDEGFLRCNVLPNAAEAWYDPHSVKIGFRADVLASEQETEGPFGETIGGCPR